MPERNRGYLREQRLKSIKKRRRLIKGQKYSGRYLGEWIDEPEFKSGVLAKGHNGLLGRGGTAVKTNTRKGHASYRHKGAYGPADNYSKHDKQQVEDGSQQIKEWEKMDMPCLAQTFIRKMKNFKGLLVCVMQLLWY